MAEAQYMHRTGSLLRNRLAIVAAVLAGPAMVIAVPTASAQAAAGTPPQLICPPGNTDTTYCADYCPGATLVGNLCVAAQSVVTGGAGDGRHRVRRRRV